MRKIFLGDSRLLLIAEVGMIVDSRNGKTYSEVGINETELEFYHDDMNEELKEAKNEKLNEIELYDTSTEVNAFYYKGLKLWIDKATRVGLMNAIECYDVLKKESITFGISGISVTLPLVNAKAMLAALEAYALECYNVTLAHKNAVNELNSVEDVKAFNVADGYPEKLTFE